MLRITLFALFFSSPGNAQDAGTSKAAAWLMGQQVAAACSNGGRFEDGYFEQDFNQDGRRDLVLSHDGISCNGDWRRSQFCGAQACTILFYIRQPDGLLKKVDEALGAMVEVDTSTPPIVSMLQHGGAPLVLRWAGSRFEVIPQ